MNPLRDILALPTEYRMNFPGKAEGYWQRRFEWPQVHHCHGQRLREMTRLSGWAGTVAGA